MSERPDPAIGGVGERYNSETNPVAGSYRYVGCVQILCNDQGCLDLLHVSEQAFAIVLLDPGALPDLNG